MTTPLPLVGEVPDLTGAACQGRSWLFEDAHEHSVQTGPKPSRRLPDHPDVTHAREVCAGCPVLTECRDWAFDAGQPGFLGGLTETERREIRRRR